jgi:hypothetical protein
VAESPALFVKWNGRGGLVSKNKGSHGIYELTCISDKCSRRFKVIYDTRVVIKDGADQFDKRLNAWVEVQLECVELTYPFTGCPFCGAWWCTGPLDAAAYPKKKQVSYAVPVNPLLQAVLQGQANMARGAIGPLGGGLAQGLGGVTMRWWG